MVMGDVELSEPAEFLEGRLCWVTHFGGPPPTDTVRFHYFSIDDVLVYEPFFKDFGPLNLAMTYRYCKMVDEKLNDPLLRQKKIVHYTSSDARKRTNAAYLIGAYMVIVKRLSADAAYRPLLSFSQSLIPFRDASANLNGNLFPLTVLDCLRGLQKSMEVGLFDWERFDVETYEFFEKVENGDLNWILPNKFIAFAGPSPTAVDEDGFPAFTPEDYVPIFLDAGVRLVVRLNKRQYDRKRFIDHGIKHADLFFADGTCPPADIISKFFKITESEPGPCAVHCKAGLGRTGTLIGLFAMKHCRFPSKAFIGWNRICRPGSILGPQQQFLVDMEQSMFQAGELSRRPRALPASKEEESLAAKMKVLALRELSAAEKTEDVGQGEALCRARRVVTATPILTTSGNSRWR
mmetsp:Transcript_96225/g.167114  ORF Transcript_96225/g.167114 Transcript_96225/m.167114 type:complete len:406 (+) Transcript_96225:108-1325(+)